MQITSVYHLQALVRGQRLARGESQAALARRAGVSRKWLSEFERGVTLAVELPLVLRVLAALDLALDAVPVARGGDLEDDSNVDLDELLEACRGADPGGP